jgi:hypothetical protein
MRDFNEARRFLSVTLSKTKHSAKKKRNLDFDISIDYVMKLLKKQKGKCALTGWDLEFQRGGSWHGKNPRGATLDRINSNKGYVKGNVWLACCKPNIIKSSLSIKEFRHLCKSVVQCKK